MPGAGLGSVVLRFDVFEIDLRAGELRKEGRRIKLQDQPFRVLSLLLERPGEVVTRDELHQRLWPADTFVDFDHGLNSAVARLREALGDSAEKPRFIETLAKRGYRFIAPLEDLVPSPPALNSDQQARTQPQPRRFALSKLWVAAAIALGLLGIVGVSAFYRRSPETPLAFMRVVPLVGLRGFQATPAFSPDGSLVAFRQSDAARNTGIYTALVGGEKPLQITSDPGDCCPTWSPDGRQIAFSRYSEKGFLSIYTAPALGGTARRVYRGPAAVMGAGISWSPDGRFLLFSESSTADPTRSRLSLLTLADSSTRPFTSPPAGWLDNEPTFSPDGSQVAFIRSAIAGVSNDVYVMPASGGEAERLTFDNRPIMGPPTWTADGREILFSSDRGVTTGLWRVPATGGTPRPVAGVIGEAKWPSLPRKGDTLAYENVVSKSDIWQIDLRSAKGREKSPSLVISEKGDKARPDISPDGRRIAFESNRLGFWDIWTCDFDGANCDQVTSLHGTAGRPRWSPDGRHIAFEFHPNAHSEIYVVEVPGGTPHLLRTIPGADNLSPSWSRDGKWLYFASKSGSEPFRIWKIPSQGDSVPTKVTTDGGISPVESPDGRYLYYSKYEQGGVWRMPLQGGPETKVLSDIGGEGWPNWAIAANGLYFLRLGDFPHASIDFLDFETGRSVSLWTLQKAAGWGLSLSNDGRSLVYVQDEFAQSSIMLVNNFR